MPRLTTSLPKNIAVSPGQVGQGFSSQAGCRLGPGLGVCGVEVAVKSGVSCVLGEAQVSSEGFLLRDIFMSGSPDICK